MREQYNSNQKFSCPLTSQADFDIPVFDSQSNFKFNLVSSGSSLGITVCLYDPSRLLPVLIDHTPFPFGLLSLNSPL